MKTFFLTISNVFDVMPIKKLVVYATSLHSVAMNSHKAYPKFSTICLQIKKAFMIFNT